MGYKEIAAFCKIDIAWDLQKLGIILQNIVHIKLLLLQVREICEVINAGTQPIQNLSVMVKHSSEQSERVKWSHFWIEKGLQSVEILIEKCSGNFCVGDTLTMADCCLVPQVYNANRFKVDMNQFPNINRIMKNLESIEAFIAAHPDSQPDKQ